MGIITFITHIITMVVITIAIMDITIMAIVIILVGIQCLYQYLIQKNYVPSLRIAMFLLVPILMYTVRLLVILNHHLAVVHQFLQLVHQDLFLQEVLPLLAHPLVHPLVDEEQHAVINFTNSFRVSI